MAASMSSTSNVTDRRELLVGVDLDDHEHLGKERFDPFVATREGNTHEDKVAPAGRDDGRRYVCGPQLGDRPHVRDLGVSTMSDSRAHHPTAIVTRKVRRPESPPWQPSRGPRSAPGSARSLGLPRFPDRGAGRLSSSKRASAVSRSASSNTSLRLTMSPSTVKTAIPRHSASKPSCEVSCAA